VDYIAGIPSAENVKLVFTSSNTSDVFRMNDIRLIGKESGYIPEIPPTFGEITKTVCDSFTINDSVYTVSDTYTQHFTNVAGGDSTLTIYLTVNTSTSGTLTLTVNDSLAINDSVYKTSGTHVQHLTNAAGCDSTLTIYLTVNITPPPSSIRDVETLHTTSLQVFPNPVTNELHIVIPNEMRELPAIVEIFDINGKRVHSHPAPRTSHLAPFSIDISNLPNGTYIVKFGNSYAKIVKQ
jgi:hypothetical protein